MKRPILIALGCLVATPARAQTSPFLPDPLFQRLANEISGDRAFEYDRHLTHFHRTAGSKDFFAAAEYIRQAAAEAGLEDVKLVRQKWNGHGWSCSFGEAWLTEPEELKLASYGAVAVSIADNSRTTHVNADLVDVGEGAAAKDYEGKDVKGKIVLASGSTGRVHDEAVLKRGALGVVSYQTHRPESFDAPDQVAWSQIRYEAKDLDGVKDGTPGTFGVIVSPRRGRWLQKKLAEGKPAKVKVDIESSFDSEQALVEGWIHGSEIHDQQILLTAHIQEEMTSANDDGSGCANMLEIGRALTRLIKDGRLPRPRRDIRFWWVNELASQPQYFRENPREPRKMLVAINQDMVGARQSLGGRVQYASRLPWSLPHPLDDVMESVLTMLSDANTSFLAVRGSKLPAPFTREVTAVKGSREPFHARMVPYYDSTDHHAFTPARVGVPATSLTNWPDEFIHGTGDDLDQVDATQLQRNAVVVTAVALYFGSVEEEDAPALAAFVAARGRSRIAADVAKAVAHVAESEPKERDAAYRAARNLIHQSYLKEAGVVSSVKRLAPKGRANDVVAHAVSRLEDGEGNDLSALEKAYQGLTGKNPPNLDLSKEEKDMSTRIFTPVADYGAWLDAMEKLKPSDGLHSLARFEVFNFADGKHNAYEIYEAVAGEALSAGAWYYGSVKPADVLKALEDATAAGALTVKGSK